MKDDEKLVLKKLTLLTERIVNALDPNNVDQISKLVDRFAAEFQKTLAQPKSETHSSQPIWKQFSSMSEAQITAEFNDEKKYPDIESIKRAVKGYVDLHKVGKVKTRETLIKHILETYRRGSFISGSPVSDRVGNSRV